MTALTETLHTGGFLVSWLPGLSFEQVTIDESQDLVAGQVVAQAANGNYVAYDNDTTDGAEAAGILYEAVSTGTGETKKATIVARLAEVRDADITWGSANDTADITAGEADLDALFIIRR